MFHNRLATSSAKGIVADYRQQQKKKSVGEELRKVVMGRHAGAGALLREIGALSMGPGRLNAIEYVRYQLYRRDISMEEKQRFISDRLHWKICDLCSNPYWRAMTEDKWTCSMVLAAAGIPVPKTVAVFDSTLRNYGNTRTLHSAAELAAFLGRPQAYPLFVKPADQLGSFGAFAINGAIDGRAVLHDGSLVSAEEMVTGMFGAESFLLQETLVNHPDMDVLAPRLATLRLMNFVRPEGVETPFALLKIPTGSNIADNFWRRGNMLADVDVETGLIRRIVRGTGVDQELILQGVGLALPYWAEVRAVNEAVARLFPKVAFSSLDIGITPDGPVVVEVNSGGSFDLVQVASGKGLLTPEVAAFFREHGWRQRRKAA